MKKNKILLAKISVVVILLFTVILGFLTLVDFLDKPKTLFYSSIETIYEDLNNRMLELQKNDIYKLMNNNTMVINSDTKINMTGLVDSEYAKYQDSLNSTSFLTTMSIDKSNKYLNTYIKAVNGTSEYLHLNYLDINFQKYIKKTEISDNYQTIVLDDFNVEMIDLNKNIYIGDVFKTELLKILTDEKFEMREESISINDQEISTHVSSYTLTGTEFETLIDNIILGLLQNGNTLNYLSDIFGIKANEVKNKLLDIKKKMIISELSNYTFEAYTKVDNDDTVRFSLMEDTFDNRKIYQFVYDKILDHTSFQIQDSTILIINGNLNKEAQVIINIDNFEISFSLNKVSDTISGKIEISDISQNVKILSGKYSCMIKNNNANKSTASFTASLEWFIDSEVAKLEINSALAVEKNIAINRESINETNLTTDPMFNNFTNALNGLLDMIFTYNILNVTD